MGNSKLSEDELHFLTTRTAHQNLSINLLLTARAWTIDSKAQFTNIMSSEDTTVVAILAKFLVEVIELRDSLL